MSAEDAKHELLLRRRSARARARLEQKLQTLEHRGEHLVDDAKHLAVVVVGVTFGITAGIAGALLYALRRRPTAPGSTLPREPSLLSMAATSLTLAFAGLLVVVSRRRTRSEPGALPANALATLPSTRNYVASSRPSSLRVSHSKS